MSSVKFFNKKSTLAVVVMASLFSVSAAAADRALLIGVGKHQDSRMNLPGIELDVSIMKDVTQLLGFKENQVKVLMDEQSTLKNVENTMKSWLTQGVTSKDRVLIYFSGHGTRVPDDNGDEKDNADEVMVMHDAKVVRKNGKASLKNVFRDDNLNRILAKIPSKNVLVFVDSCHSGSITKSLTLDSRAFGDVEAASKFFAYPGMPKGDNVTSSKGDVMKYKGNIDNYISVVAAQDDEESIATSKGSIFTLGLRKAIREAASKKKDITPKEIHKFVTKYVKQKRPSKPFHPNLLGSDRLANKSIFVAKLNGHGPTWKRMEKIVTKSKPLSVKQNRTSYKLGDTMTIAVDIEKEGYLNVVNIGPDDKTTVLFPNKHHKSNKVGAGKFTIPTTKMDFDLTAQEPVGQTMTVAIITSKPIDLYKRSISQRNSKGVVTDLFGELSDFSMKDLEERSFGVTQRERDVVFAGKIIASVSK